MIFGLHLETPRSHMCKPQIPHLCLFLFPKKTVFSPLPYLPVSQLICTPFLLWFPYYNTIFTTPIPLTSFFPLLFLLFPTFNSPSFLPLQCFRNSLSYRPILLAGNYELLGQPLLSYMKILGTFFLGHMGHSMTLTDYISLSFLPTLTHFNILFFFNLFLLPLLFLPC